MAVMLVPMDPSEWVKTKFPFKKFPDFNFSQSIQISNDSAVGGYFYKLPKPIEIGSLEFIQLKAQIDKFPKVKINMPFQKKQDDYAFRLGLMLSDGRNSSIPSFVQSKIGRQFPVTKMIYFQFASLDGEIEMCGKSPHNSFSIYCVLNTSEGKEFLLNLNLENKALKVLKNRKKLRLVGLWLFSDTDDSGSKSNAVVRKISIKTR
ncbi:MAG: hypothetical protein AB8E15_11275 [Bdellovibrionales bacterium]